MHSKEIRSLSWPLLAFFGAAPGRYAVALIVWTTMVGVLLLRGRAGRLCVWLHGLASGWQIVAGVAMLLLACDAVLVVSYFLHVLKSWSEDAFAAAMQWCSMALGAGGAVVFFSLGILISRRSSALLGIGRWLDALPRGQRVTMGMVCLFLAAWVLYTAWQAFWWLNAFQPKRLVF